MTASETTTDLGAYVKRFSRASVLVVGDAMLDRYVYGEVTRVSPEAPVPILTAIVSVVTWRAFYGRTEALPFIGGILLFLLAYLGIGISIFPMIVPGQFSLREAASSPRTQAFLLVGTLALLPIIFMYTGWSYWVFRGKVRSNTGYH